MCDIVVALPVATGGRTIFAKNSDRPLGEVQVLDHVAPRRDRSAVRCTHIEVDPAAHDTLACVVSRPLWCWGAEHGVNEAGVAVGNATVYTTLDPRGARTGLTGMDLVRLALERATTTLEAASVIVEHLQRYGQGGSGYSSTYVPDGRPYWNSFLVADPTSACVIDTSGTQFSVESVVDVRAVSNRTSIGEFDRVHRHPRQPVERYVEQRLRASERLLAGHPVSVDAVVEHLRSHTVEGGEPGWTVCMHADQVTAASMVAELGVDGTSMVWAVQGSPCAADYISVGVR